MAFLEAVEQENNYGEPLATSYHSKSMGTVDYIWHIEELVLVRVLETLTVDVLRKTGGLPSEKWGSNHPTLVCALAFADDGSSSWPGSSPLIGIYWKLVYKMPFYAVSWSWAAALKFPL